MSGQLRVSEAARLVGVSPSTLRAWESFGLVKPSRKGRNRRFSTRDVEDLQQIASLRTQGLNIVAIRSRLRRDGKQPADHPQVQDRAIGPPEQPLGEKLRSARRLRGLSLREASSLARLSVSHLSAIERGERNISLAGLQRLAVSLGIQISDLFDTSGRVGGRLVHAEARPTLDTGDPRVRIESLSLGAQLLEPHMYTVEPGGGSDGSYHHEGEELVYVLRGEVEFWLNEVDRHVVRAGDCLTFASSLRHRWRNAGLERLEMLWVNTPITF
jgi:DNA-binding transcriptional MerR regulator/quercetin dioxygenase-like cupin family protein